MTYCDRYDYMGKCRERQRQQNLVERRRLTVPATPQVAVKVMGADAEVSEFLFDSAPTLSDLIAQAGGGATIVSVETVTRPVRLFG